ncbi:antibiotic biosynthesis monooxygenase family protein [Thalassotalea crassostreae]|uniref:antibiotic biosynthesis monooxygenase family protein n=1 Tax=Thalassotalea crassostreae TaxID=1763536 RepID=UPI000837B271|nr:antibiotic biosynthesis monooxygenase [Thalassotalea crassostreae]
MIANTPKPPYYAVIFSSILNESDNQNYQKMAVTMENLAKQQPGFLGFESAREDIGITISFWRDLESIKQWKNNSEHKVAQQQGKDYWYKAYTTRICKVERDYHL